MKKSKLTGRDKALLVFLLILVIGVAYYMLFYKPLQAELASISNQAADMDTQIMTAQSKIAKMDSMQAEIDEILSRPEDEISEIAPFDNKEEVLNQLNAIMRASEQYNLSFSEPVIGGDGSVRRNVSMNFSCSDFTTAKNIIHRLQNCKWRCLVSNLSFSGSDGVMSGTVSVNATATFFESTNLAE